MSLDNMTSEEITEFVHRIGATPMVDFSFIQGHGDMDRELMIIMFGSKAREYIYDPPQCLRIKKFDWIGYLAENGFQIKDHFWRNIRR